GTVVDATAAPLAGAHVRVQGCLGGPVVTDATGTFTLPVPAGPVVVAAAADGYYNGCVGAANGICAAVAPGSTALRIVLHALPAGDACAHVFRSPETCQACHADIYQQWSSSTKAHTNGNRWVNNLYNGTDILQPPGPPSDPANPPYFAFLASHNVDPAHPA